MQYMKVNSQQQTNNLFDKEQENYCSYLARGLFLPYLKIVTLNTVWGQIEFIVSYFYFILPILSNDLFIYSLVPVLAFT